MADSGSRWAVAIVAIAVIIIVALALFLMLTDFIGWANSLVNSLGYFGIFVITLIGNALLFLPVPSYMIVIMMGGILNPWLVGIFAGLGAAIGELTGYAIGRGGRYVIKKKYKKLLKKTRTWSEKHGLFPLIVLFAATPLPDDIVGIIGGVIKYDIRKFLTANIIGKIIAHTSLAWFGFFGSWLLGGWSMLMFIVLSMVLLVIVLKAVTAEAKKPGKPARAKKKTR